MEENESALSRRSLLHTGAAALTVAAVGAALPASAATASPSPGDTPGTGASAATLAAYPIPDGIAQNPSFAVKARTPGRDWQQVQCYQVNAMIIDPASGHGILKPTSVARFDFTGTVEVSVTYTVDRIQTAVIRPLSYAIPNEVSGHNTVTFILDQPRNLCVEVNGDIFDCLQLFTGAIDPSPPSADDPNVIYFGPGVHAPSSGTVEVASGQTCYLAGGAVLKARVVFENVDGAKLLGPGVLYNSSGGAITAEYSTNLTIDGVTALNPHGYTVTAGQVTGLTISNLRSVSSAGNADGIDLFCCQNAVIDGVYMRNSDDCVAIYNHRWNYYGNSDNITVKNSSLWADVAHPVNVGTHGNTADNETISNLTIENIDILDHREPQLDYQGCIALNPGDGNLITQVEITDIRVEDFRLGQLINMRVMYNTKYNTSVGRGIDTVYIKNLAYTGTHAWPSILVGYDESHLITNVTFENLVVNGAKIYDGDGHAAWYKTSDYVPMFTNEHVTNLTFIPAKAG